MKNVLVKVIWPSGFCHYDDTKVFLVDEDGNPVLDSVTGEELHLLFTHLSIDMPPIGPVTATAEIILVTGEFVGHMSLPDGTLRELERFNIHLKEDDAPQV